MALGVTLHGPVFDGRSTGFAAQMVMEVKKTVSLAAMESWIGGMHRTFRHPTGTYESRINVERRDLAYVVNDRASVYGPWLEGTGSRNSPVTRFPGYHNAVAATAETDARAAELAQPAVALYVDRLNHE